MAGALETTRSMLKEGAEALAGDKTGGDAARGGFQKFRQGVVRAQSGNGAAPAELMDEVLPKADVLIALVTLAVKHGIYKKQIAYNLRLLVDGSEAWAEAWRVASLPEGVDVEAMFGLPRSRPAAEADAAEEAAASPTGAAAEESPTDAAAEQGRTAAAAQEEEAATVISELQRGFQELEAIDFEPSAKRAPWAFRCLSRGIDKVKLDSGGAQSDSAGVLAEADAFDRKGDALHFLLELHGLKKLYRQKVATCIAKFLKVPSWAAACSGDNSLEERLEEELQLHTLAERAPDGGGSGDHAAFKKAGQALRRQAAAVLAMQKSATSATADAPAAAADGSANQEEVTKHLEAMVEEQLPPILAEFGISEDDFEHAVEDYIAAYLQVAEKLVERGERTWGSLLQGETLELVEPKAFAKWHARMCT